MEQFSPMLKAHGENVHLGTATINAVKNQEFW